MTFALRLEDLLAYTDWDREQWHAWFRHQGPAALDVGLGPNGDGRINSVGELVRHIFSAEKRYVERALGKPLTDTSTVSTSDVDALFAFGVVSRTALRELLGTMPAERWDIPHEMQIGTRSLRVTPRKMIVQAVTHELRHWAQVATFIRLDGRQSGVHDFLVSPVFDVPAAGSGS